MPQPQDPGEVEYFAAPLFVTQVEGHRLRVSISAHMCGLFLDLQRDSSPIPTLEYRVSEIESIAIERRDAVRWLRARARSGEMIELAIEPVLSVRIVREG